MIHHLRTICRVLVGSTAIGCGGEPAAQAEASTGADAGTTAAPPNGDSSGETGVPTTGDGERGDPTVDSLPFAPALPGRGVEAMLAYAPGVGHAAAWYESDDVLVPGPAGPAGRCAFSVSGDGGATWSAAHRRVYPTHPIGANPVVAIDAAGTIYAVCMSLETDYSAGVLELSTSTDRGATWSDWSTIVARDQGFPDKPWISAPAAGVLHVVYTDVDADIPPAPKLPKIRSYATLLGSSNGGETWSAPVVLSQSALDPEPPVVGIIGTSVVALPDGELGFSWGEYNLGAIRFTTLQRHLDGEAPIAVVPAVDVEGPITQIVASPDGAQIVVLWYPAHDFGPLGLARSSDRGQTWDVVPALRERAAVPVATIDAEQRLHMLWSDRSGAADGSLVQSFYGSLDLLAAGQWQLAGSELAAYSAKAGSEGLYIGAYQGLAVDAAGGLQALWMRWDGPGSLLVHTRLRWP